MPESASLIDVLDRVLDKGIIVDAYFRVALAGIDVISVDAQVVVASIDTYFAYTDALQITSPLTPNPRIQLQPALAGSAMGGGPAEG